MTKSKFVIDKIAKLLEQGLISYKDLSQEIVNVLKSKKDEIIFKLDLSTKEELEILKKRVDLLEKKTGFITVSKNTKAQVLDFLGFRKMSNFFECIR